LSFRKRRWELSDYPIDIIEQTPDPKSNYDAPRFTVPRYVARITRWWAISGKGETLQEAMADLQIRFDTTMANRRAEGRPQIRPGLLAPIEFASQELIERNHELSEDFIHRVLDLEWAWISDESKLADFHTEPDNTVLVNMIREVYAVDVSDIESARLAEILNRIAALGNFKTRL